jgi:acyl transferase domain-containing protein
VFRGEARDVLEVARECDAARPAFRQIVDRHLGDLGPAEQQSHSSDWRTAAEIEPGTVYTLEIALAELWRSWGIEPSGAAGIGAGEYAAACTAGLFSMADGLKRIRGRQSGTDGGEAGGLKWQSPRLTLIALRDGAPGDALPSWSQDDNGRTVSRDALLDRLRQEGFDCLLEPGNATLSWCTPARSERWATGGPAGSSVRERIFRSIAEIYVAGLPLDWSRFREGTRRERIPLPTYPFQRRRYWIDGATGSGATSAAADGRAASGRHPLLGVRHHSALHRGHIEFEGEIGIAAPAFLAEHRVFGQPVPPASLYVEMALAAGALASEPERVVLKDFVIHHPLILPENSRRAVHVLLTPEGDGSYHFEVSSRAMLDQHELTWTRHATCVIRPHGTPSPPARRSLTQFRDLCAEEVPIDDFYRAYDRLGIQFGPGFRAVERVWRSHRAGRGDALGRIRLPAAIVAAASTYQLHPVLLDAACQVIGAAVPETAGEDTYLMSAYERIVVFGPLDSVMWSQVELQTAVGAQPPMWSGNLFLCGEGGDVRVAVEGFRLLRADADSLFAAHPESLRGQLFHIQWRPRPRQARPSPAEGAPSVRDLEKLLQPCLASSLACPEMALYEEVLREFESLSAIYVARALRGMGCPFTPGNRLDGQALAVRLGVERRHRRLWMRLLEVLSEEGVLQADGDHWKVVSTLPDRDPSEIRSRLAAGAAEIAPITDLLDRCARELPAVLRGASDPQELLFPGGDFSHAAALYRENSGARMMNALVREAIVAAVKNAPVGRTLRILELGGGTGGTTASILPALPSHGIRYVFTDLSPFFTARAQESFGDYPFVEYRTLDIERSPREQGFDSESFDVVIAANVLHATRDLRQALRHVRETMVPGGLLLLLEVSGRQRWLDLTFGYTEGWWRFSDHDLRPSYPLLSASEWQKLLEECGFGETARLAAGPERGPLSQQALIFGRTASAQATASRYDASPAWLICGESGGLGRRLAEQLWAEGARCTLVVSGQSYESRDAGVSELNTSDPEHVVSLVRAIGAHSELCNVVIMGGIDGATDRASTSELRAAVDAPLECTLNLIRAFAGASHGSRPRFYLVTRGVHGIGDDDAICVSGAPLWGLGKVIALEHPQWWGGLVDLAHEPCATETDFVFGQIREGDGEDQVAYRSGTRFVPRLARCEIEKSTALRLRADASYLITGGLGVLGLRVARWMVARGARQIFLVGRSDPTQQAREAIAELSGAGAAITTVPADVANENQMRALLKRIDGTPAPLLGVIHAAGVGRLELLQEMPRTALDSVLHPKIDGVWVLDQLTRDRPLDFFVSFSSMVSVWGARGMGHYAAANHFLDTLCRRRRQNGRPGLSINWGPWAGGGMLPAEAQDGLARMGMISLNPDRAIEALDYLIGGNLSQAIVANVDWVKYKAAHEAKGRRHLFDEISIPTTTSVTRTTVSSHWQSRLMGAAQEDRPALLREIVCEALGAVLRIDDATVLDANRGLFDMGMDSLLAVELKKQLENGLRVSLSSTLVFDHPTINALAQHLVSELGWVRPISARGAAPVPAADFPVQVQHIPDHELAACIEEDLQKLEGWLTHD